MLKGGDTAGASVIVSCRSFRIEPHSRRGRQVVGRSFADAPWHPCKFRVGQILKRIAGHAGNARSQGADRIAVHTRIAVSRIAVTVDAPPPLFGSIQLNRTFQIDEICCNHCSQRLVAVSHSNSITKKLALRDDASSLIKDQLPVECIGGMHSAHDA